MLRPLHPPRILVLLAALLLGSACSRLPDMPIGVYRIDIQQGNVLDEDMLARLSPGMEKRKVRFVLGTPMLIDTFNEDRWDYIFTYSRAGGRIEQRQVTLFFEDDRLARIEGDVHRGDGTRQATRRETLVKVPEEAPSGGVLDALQPGLEFLLPGGEETLDAPGTSEPLPETGVETETEP